MTKFAYYAGPIDDPNLDAAVECSVRQGAIKAARGAGYAVFQPQTAYANADKEPGVVQEVNNSVIERASVVLVDLCSPGRRVGTLLEVGFAVARGVPVVAVVESASPLLGHLALNQSLVALHRVEGVPVTVRDWMEVWVGALMKVAVRRSRGSLVSTVPVRRWDVEPTFEPKEKLVINPRAPLRLEYWFDQDACGPFGVKAVYGPPARTYRGDAGWDLPVARLTRVPPGEFVDVPLAYRLAPPPGHWYRLTGRSSTLRKYNLLVNEGVIDEGYRGPLFAGVWNLGEEEVVLEPNQRIAQVIPHRVVADAVELVGVEELRAGERGEAGFGSTGR